MEEQEVKTMKPERKNFFLKKAKEVKFGGLKAVYSAGETVGQEFYENKYEAETGKAVHPDLSDLYKDLRPIVARVFNINSFLSMIEASDFKASEEQIEIARSCADSILQKINVTQISISGSDDRKGVVITSSYECSNGQVSCLNTPRIMFGTDSYGFEEELEAIVNKIENEVYEYLFNGKKAQQELFGESKEEEETEESGLFDGED